MAYIFKDLIVYAVALLALGACTVGQIEEERDFYVDQIVPISLTTTPCDVPGSGILGSLSIVADNETCNAASCSLYAEQLVAYSLTFSSASSIKGYVSTVSGVSTTDLEKDTTRYVSGALNAGASVTLNQHFALPIYTNESKYTVEWNILSTTNQTILCRRFDFSVLNWTSPSTGTLIGDPCNDIGQPCQFPNSACKSSLKCGCDSLSEQDGTACKLKTGYGFGCTSDTDCGPREVCDLEATSNVCRCAPEYEEIGEVCVEIVVGSNLGEPCSMQNYPCNFPNSVCGADLTCQCKASTVAYPDGTCKLLPDYPCADDNDCITGTTCEIAGTNKVCSCGIGYVIYQGECVLGREATRPGALCDEPLVSCSFDHSVCREDTKTCACDDNYIFEDNECRLKAGSDCYPYDDSPCVANAECVVNAIGANRTCVCRAQFTDFNGVCVTNFGSRVGDACNNVNLPCLFENSVCEGTEASTCQCASGAVEQSGICRIKEGNDCISTADCVAFSTCSEGKCVCDSGYDVSDEGHCAGCALAIYAPLVLLSVLVSKLLECKSCSM